MPLSKNHPKKQSVPAPEEPKKGVRQLMAEQESGCEIRHITDPKPEAGKVYQAEYWEIANVAGESLQAAADAYDKIRYDDPRKAAEIAAGLDACTFERDRIDKAHPRLSAALPEIAAVRYDSLGSALCALEKATYGFDLSGREPEREPDLTWTHDLDLNAARAIGKVAADPQPAPEKPKPACAPFAHPTVTIEFLGEGANPKVSNVIVSCHGVLFAGGDPSGGYSTVEEAIEFLGKAIAGPCAKRKGGKPKKAKR
jgi:hypothetical protein